VYVSSTPYSYSPFTGAVLGSGGAGDRTWNIKVDPQKFVYVCGLYNTTANIYDRSGTVLGTLPTVTGDAAFACKFSSTGALQYSLVVDSAGSDVAQSLITDSTSNVYLTGYYAGTPNIIFRSNLNASTTLGTLPVSSGNSVFSCKFSSTGTLLYSLVFDGTGSDAGFGSSVDSLNNFYVGGNYNSTSNVNVVFRSNSNVSTTLGTLPISSGDAAFTTKFSSTGELQHSFVVDATTNNDRSWAIACDAFSNVYFGGQYNGTPNIVFRSNSNVSTTLGTLPATTGSDVAFATKCSDSGALQYSLIIDGTGSDIGYSLACDSFSNLYISGQYSGTPNIIFRSNANVSTTVGTLSAVSGTFDGFVSKFSSTGTLQYSHILSGTGNESAWSVSCENSNVVVGGYYNGTPSLFRRSNANVSVLVDTFPAGTFDNAFVSKFDSNGRYFFSIVSDSPNNDSNYTTSTDQNGNLYFGGQNQNGTLRDVTSRQFLNYSIINPEIPTINYVQLGLVGYWDMATYVTGTASWSGTGTTITDLSGAGNNLVLSPGNAGTYTTGTTPHIVIGTSTYADKTVTLNLNSTGLTFECLVQLTSTTAFSSLMFFNNARVNNSTAGMRLSTLSATAPLVGLGTWNGIGNYALTNGISQNTWYHIIVTIPGGQLSGNPGVETWYINGSVATSSSQNNGSGVLPGSITYNLGFGYDGETSRVAATSRFAMGRVYNRVLTAAEVTQNYNSVYSVSSGNPYSLPPSPLPTIPARLGAYYTRTTPTGSTGIPQLGYYTNFERIINAGSGSEVRGIACDAGSNIYASYFYNGTTPTIVDTNSTIHGSLPTSTGLASALTKFDSAGTVLFSRIVESAGNDSSYSLAVDSTQSNVYLGTNLLGSATVRNQAGTTIGTIPAPLTNGALVSKFSTKTGDYQYSLMVDGSGGNDGLNTVSCDPFSNVYFGGFCTGQINVFYINTLGTATRMGTFSGTNTGFLTKCDPNGNLLYTLIMNVGGGIGQGIRGSACDPTGNVYMSGFTFTAGGTIIRVSNSNVSTTLGTLLPTPSSYAASTIKFDLTGNLLYSLYIESVNADFTNSVTCDAGSNVYVAGDYNGTPNIIRVSNSNVSTTIGTLPLSSGAAAFLSKFSPTGNLLYSYTLDSTTNSDISLGTTTDLYGNVYFTGEYNGTPTLRFISNSNVATTVTTLPASSGISAFMISISPTGTFNYARILDATTNADMGYAVACDPDGNVFFGGLYNGVTDIRDHLGTTIGTLPNLGSRGFITKFAGSSTPIPQNLPATLSNVFYTTVPFMNAPNESRLVDTDVDTSGNVFFLSQRTTTAPILTSKNAVGIKTMPAATTRSTSLVKFNNKGLYEWDVYATNFGNAGLNTDVMCSLTHENSNVYIGSQQTAANVVTFYNTSNVAVADIPASLSADTSDCYIAKFDTNGTFQWKSYVQGAYNFFPSVAASPNDNAVYLAGTKGFAQMNVFTSVPIDDERNPEPVSYTLPSSFIFTNANTSGVNGPTLSNLQSEYSSYPWTQNTSYLNVVTQGYQRWTVPFTGTYRIIAGGAKGGNSTNLSAGGRGVVVSTTLSLTQGDTINIVVGQTGLNGTSYGGGGGGTFVAYTNNSPILVAGGGGGVWNTGSSGTLSDGQLSTVGATGYAGGTAPITVGGAGGVNSMTGGTSGGAGFTSNVAPDGRINPNRAFINGAVGFDGGFGCAYAGGGGYSGGGGITWGGQGRAGGGGSYDINGAGNAATLYTGKLPESITTVSAGYNTGNGFVAISSDAITGTVPSTLVGYGAYLIKYNREGVLLWRTRIDSSNVVNRGVITDSKSNVYLTGYCTGTTTANVYSPGQLAAVITKSGTNDAVYLVKYLSDGSFSWYAFMNTTSAGGAQQFGHGCDPKSNVYVSGFTTPNMGIFDRTNYSVARTTIPGASGFLVKFSEDGFYQWYANVYSPTNVTFDKVGTDIDFDAGSSVYATFSFLTPTIGATSTVAIRDGLGAINTIAIGVINASFNMVVKFSESGVFQWACPQTTVVPGRCNSALSVFGSNVYTSGTKLTTATTIRDRNLTAATTIPTTSVNAAYITQYFTDGTYAFNDFQVTNFSTLLNIQPASGGTITGPVSIGGVTYFVHVFTTSGTFTTTNDISCDILVVGGGGGAAGYQSGGAGAGGLVFVPNFSVSPGTTTVTIGNGGVGVSAGVPYGNPGQNTTFGTLLTAVGGARGVGTNNSTAGEPGGSGSGACVGIGNTANQAGGAATQPTQAGNSGIFGRGFAGGGNSNGSWPGGGGGSGGVGVTGTAINVAKGGVGLFTVTVNSVVYNFATIFNTTSYGQLSGGNIYFAGGGSGGYGGTTNLGGGGNGGGNFSGGTSGLANTGGGAGGAGNGFGGTNASGGSGIVMLRYRV
jgi:hypothetical protein